jgi:hypothetical protein
MIGHDRQPAVRGERDVIMIGGPCVLCGRPQVEHGNGICPTSKQIGMASFLKDIQRRAAVTTKVRITNIVEEGNAHSNGDVVIHGLAAGRLILAPGESHEEWLKHSDLPEPITITERWPSQAK